MKIGFNRHGGLGDGIVATAIVEAIKEKYPGRITGFLTGSVYKVFRGSVKVEEAIYTATPGVKEDLIRANHPWDIWFDVKPVPGVFFCSDFENLETEQQKEWKEKLHDLRLRYPDCIRELEQFGMRQIEFISTALDLPVKQPVWNKFSRINHLYSKKTVYNPNPTPEPLTYATLGNEAWGQCPTKSYPFWDRVLPDFPVYQLGEFEDETIGNCINLTGKLTLKESCQFVCNAKFHMGIEGFFNHFCEIWKIPRVIFFGPTSEPFFGYDSAINIQNGECRNCQWLTGNWMNKCPKGYSYSERPCVLGLEEMFINEVVKCL